MSPYLLVSLLPVLYNVIPSPHLVRWYRTNPRSAPIPDDVRVQIEQSSIHSAFIAQLILLAVVIVIVRRNELGLTEMGFSSYEWLGNVLLGCIAGLACVSVYGIGALFVPRASRVERRWEIRVPLWKWTMLSLSSSLVEELWRAASLVLLGRPEVVAVIATAIAFGLGHAQSRVRAIVISLVGAYLGILFVRSRSAWTLCGAHFVINMGVFSLLVVLGRKKRV